MTREREKERKREVNCAAGDKRSGTRDGNVKRYNVMNLFMQYNLAHSDYNSAKFNWIVFTCDAQGT